MHQNQREAETKANYDKLQEEFRSAESKAKDEITHLHDDKENILTDMQNLRSENNKLIDELKDVKVHAEAVEKESQMMSTELNEVLEEYKLLADSRQTEISELGKQKERIEYRN